MQPTSSLWPSASGYDSAPGDCRRGADNGLAQCARSGTPASVVTIDATHPTSAGDVVCGARWHVGACRIALLYRDMSPNNVLLMRAALLAIVVLTTPRQAASSSAVMCGFWKRSNKKLTCPTA